MTVQKMENSYINTDTTDYLLHFSFKGTDFRGWQRQVKGRTVQEILENILQRITGEPDLYLNGCSRTDAGVHALNMFASFRTSARINQEDLFRNLQKQCPHDIAICSLQRIPSGFHLQNSICGKSYVYAVYLGSYSLFLRDSCWSWPEKDLNLALVQQALTALEGTHDFRNFGGTTNGVRSTVRTLYHCRTICFGSVLCFYFSGNGFLHKMLRRIVACLHELAVGNMSLEDFRCMVDHPETDQSNDLMAPPHGLYLKNVFFQLGEIQNDTLEFPPFFR